jgi:hypothetical protein
MILATVTTCPQRWWEYHRLRRNYAGLGFHFPLRTFQSGEALHNPRVNNNLNARAALTYAARRLPDDPLSWMLYLEDDIRLRLELSEYLPFLIETGARDGIDCWYLCNRKNPVKSQFRLGGLVVNELDQPVRGSHALLLARRHLPGLLASHWGGLVDEEIFAALVCSSAKILQVVAPVLVEHIGEISTYNPHHRTQLETNHANSSNLSPASG